MEVVLVSWMILWYLDILGHVDWVLNAHEKLLFYEMDFEIYVFNKWLRNMVMGVFFFKISTRIEKLKILNVVD